MRLVFFRADWCGVCHTKAPVAEGISRERGLPLDVLDIDTERGGAEAVRMRIRTVPTLALVDGDRVRFRLVGRMISSESASFLFSRL